MKKKEKIDLSVALSYTLGEEAPIIVASGKGLVAKRIKEIAIENGIKIVEDEALANILIESEIGDCIPEATYLAIAAIFAFLQSSDL